MNLSKQMTPSEDGVSMYFSFSNDSHVAETNDSNISCKSSAFFTLDGSNHSDRDNSLGNTTLEPERDSQSDLCELSAALAPLRLQPLAHIRALKSSTPSKMDDNHGNGNNHRKDLVGGDEKSKADLSGIFKNFAGHIEVDAHDGADKENRTSSATDSMPSFSATSILKIQNKNSKPSAVSEKKCLPKTNKNNRHSIEKFFSNNKKAKMHTVVRKSHCEPDMKVDVPIHIGFDKNTILGHVDERDEYDADCDWQYFDKLGADQFLGTVSERAVPSEEEEPKNMLVFDTNMFNSSGNSKKTKKADDVARRSVMPSLPGKTMPTIAKPSLNGSTEKTSRKSNATGSNNRISKRHSVFAAPQPSLRKKGFSSNYNIPSDTHISKPRIGGGGVAIERRESNVASVPRRSIMCNTNRDVRYTCPECRASFKVKSLLDAHKQTHCIASPETQRLRSQGGSILSSNHTNNHLCKYCDKGFAIERALHIHLLEYCPKIPASERRKLNYKEMDHVAKAATPHFNNGQSISQKNNDNSKDPLMNFPVRKIENNREEFIRNRKDESAMKGKTTWMGEQFHENAQMAPPKTTKIKKKVAHAGVFRTPTKEIPCHSCKQSFMDVIDYTNHIMTTHKNLDMPKNKL